MLSKGAQEQQEIKNCNFLAYMLDIIYLYQVMPPDMPVEHC
jgi:hypothetical protein